MNTHDAMITKVRKWGNSLGVRLPKAAAQEAGVGDGSAVDVTAEDGRIVVRPVTRTRLRDLLAGVTPGNVHAGAWPDAPRGRELL